MLSSKKVKIAVNYISKLLIISTLFLFCAASSHATTEKRVALVIGNADYEHAPRLVNPVNDADALAAKLAELNFEVIKHHDLGYIALLDALDQFSRKAAGADWAMVYYAGHGIQVDGKNYLIPVDVKLLRQGHLRRTVALDDLLIETGQASKIGLVILDACRDNPFISSINQGSGRSIAGRGLARVEETGGDVLVAFATKAGAIANDGESTNSPYMQALLENLDKPGLEIRQFFGKVRDGVMELTENQQQPYTYGSLGGKRYYFRHYPILTDKPDKACWQGTFVHQAGERSDYGTDVCAIEVDYSELINNSDWDFFTSRDFKFSKGEVLSPDFMSDTEPKDGISDTMDGKSIPIKLENNVIVWGDSSCDSYLKEQTGNCDPDLAPHGTCAYAGVNWIISNPHGKGAVKRPEGRVIYRNPVNRNIESARIAESSPLRYTPCETTK